MLANVGLALLGAGICAGASELFELDPIRHRNPFRLRPTDEDAESLFRRWTMTVREVRYTRAPAGHPQGSHSYAIPANARKVPLVQRTATPFLPRRPNWSTGRGRADLLNFLRGPLSRSGYDVDPRCAMLLIANETNLGSACHCYNWGNQKAQNSVYALDLPTLIAERAVWTTNARAVGIYLLIDGYDSADGYPAYANHEQGGAWFMNFFERNHYEPTLAGFAQGGLEGLLAAEQNLAEKGYAASRLPTMAARIAARQHVARNYWANCERLCGAEWVR